MSLRATKLALGFNSTPKPKSKKLITVSEVISGSLTGIILGIAIIKTPPFWLGTDKIGKYLNASASPLPANPDFSKRQENLPEEINTLLWGIEGLNQQNIIQNSENCQIIATIRGSTYTEKALKRLESMIEVTNYNLDKENFYINFNVNINGKKIPVSYKDLTTVSPNLYNGSPQAAYILAYAIDKELSENYMPNPSGFTAQSTATFLANKEYTTLLLPVMSDASLIEVLKKAPNEIISLGSYPELNDTTRVFLDILKTETTRIEQPSKKGVTSGHEFTLKSYKYEDGKHLVKLVAYHNEEITLTLEELRKNILAITAPTKYFNIIDSRTMYTYLISLVLIVALRKAIGSKKAEIFN